MKKRDKLFTKDGLELDCELIGFMEGLTGKQIIIYIDINNEKELLASYCNENNEKLFLTEITDDAEWQYIEKTFNEIFNKYKKQND